MTILEKLNSGELHRAARQRRPECVDRFGGIHVTPERARFINWVSRKKETLGDDVRSWPEADRAEYEAHYVPSH